MFRSADQALRWAYNTSARPIVKLSAVNRMRGAQRLSSELTPYERHAQAAQIAKMVSSLDTLERAYVRANYAREVTSEEYEALTRFCRGALIPGVRAERAVVTICSAYLGEHVGWRRLRSELRCRQDKVPPIRDAIYSALDGLHSRVLHYLDRRFKAVGLIDD